MTRLDKVITAPPAIRDAALAMLDEISAPLSPRRLDQAFQGTGMSRSQARRATLALKHLDIIAVVPR